MSLNGLDEAPVIEAYQAALIEPGGWFLLKYATRDTVDLLQRGSGGVAEVRIAIEQYEVKSPIYGLVQYRRRKVVLKYVPEGTSRLLQARLAVQFQSVLEKFTPHDVVFSFTAATELTESALSSACALHTSVGSLNSSSSSIHRHRLGEITEDAEEGSRERPHSGLRHSFLSGEDGTSEEGGKNGAPEASTTSCLSVDSSLPEKKTIAIPAVKISEAPPVENLNTPGPVSPGESLQSPLEARASVGGGRVSTEHIRPSIEIERPSLDSRRSLQSHRPSTSEINRSAGYNLYKPKVKLGPRPSTQRPRTAGSKGEVRPIANLPNSVRVSTRPPSTTSRPPSSGSYRPFSSQSNKSAHSYFVTRQGSTLPPPSPQPSIQTFTLQSPKSYVHDRPSSPAISTHTTITSSLASSRPPGITPEKQRLMRALELRRKRQLAKAGEVKAPVSPKSNLESSRKLEALSTQAGSQNREPKENQTQNGEELPSHADRAKIDKDTSTKVTVPSGPDSEIAQAPADQRDTDTGHDDFFPIDSSLHSKDVEEISSTAGSDSATSEATLPSVKAAAIDNGPPPVLPPVPSQNRVGVDASSASPEQASEESRVLADDTEETVVTAVLVSPSLTAAPQVIADGNLSSQVTPKLGGSMDEKASPTQKPPPANVNELKLNTSNALYCPNPKTIQESLQVHEKAPLNTDASDTSDDESLYEELQSATVQEAKPVMVARSPISAIFNKGSPDRLRQHNGSVSSLKCKIDDTSNITPENLQDKFGRSLSSPLPQWPSTGEPVKSLLIKKTNVSSGISKRIRALEMFTGRSEAGSSPPNPNAPPSPPPTSGLVTERASAHSPKEKKGRNMSINTPPTKQFHYPSPEPTPTPPPTSLEKQSSWPQRLDSKGAVFPPRKKGEAISVTARIIRDSSEIQTDQQNYASKPAPSSLHRSPLVVEHEKADPIFQPEVIKPSKTFPSPSKEADTAPVDIPKSGRRRFSVSSRNSNADKPPQSESFTKRLSMTIRHGRTESSNLPRSGSDASSVGDEKVPKESRRTRLIKRMSVIKAKAGTRRTLASAFGSNASRHGESPAMVSQPPDSIVEQSGEVTPEDSSTGRSYAHVVDIGDVNVQFPDTLLWKRRFMRIDDQGYLILTPPTMEVNKRGISRRFHLSDFKPPALPSVEREELPFSIVLDFEDGSCLQCACESKYAQGQVMRLLTDAHAAYNSLFKQS